MDIERYRRRLLTLERQLVGRLGREVETAREPHDDQTDAGDPYCLKHQQEREEALRVRL